MVVSRGMEVMMVGMIFKMNEDVTTNQKGKIGVVPQVEKVGGVVMEAMLKMTCPQCGCQDR